MWQHHAERRRPPLRPMGPVARRGRLRSPALVVDPHARTPSLLGFCQRTNHSSQRTPPTATLADSSKTCSGSSAGKRRVRRQRACASATRCYLMLSLVAPPLFLSAPHTTSRSISVKTRADTSTASVASDKEPKAHLAHLVETRSIYWDSTPANSSQMTEYTSSWSRQAEKEVGAAAVPGWNAPHGATRGNSLRRGLALVTSP
jgi:hypothetical protein